MCNICYLLGNPCRGRLFFTFSGTSVDQLRDSFFFADQNFCRNDTLTARYLWPLYFPLKYTKKTTTALQPALQ